MLKVYEDKKERPDNVEFKPITDIQGEEFMAVRPWIGQFTDPTNRILLFINVILLAPKHDPSEPN